jgi:hypothetical protein
VVGAGWKCSMNSSKPDFFEFVSPMIGLPVSHIWRGYGSALFIELGELHSVRYKNGRVSRNPSGQMGIGIEWSWRIEGKKRIWCGSWSDESRWNRFFSMMLGSRVDSVSLFGRLPEIDLCLSNGLHLLSMMTADGEPEWSISDRRSDPSRYLSVKNGRLNIEETSISLPRVNRSALRRVK